MGELFEMSSNDRTQEARAPAQAGDYHLSEWAESGHARHRVVAAAVIGTARQEMPTVLGR